MEPPAATLRMCLGVHILEEKGLKRAERPIWSYYHNTIPCLTLLRAEKSFCVLK
jgi:hypothetical protein